jgi:hypothetical protein
LICKKDLIGNTIFQMKEENISYNSVITVQWKMAEGHDDEGTKEFLSRLGYDLRTSHYAVLESILPNFDFFIFQIFAFKLGHFKVQTIFFLLQTLKLNNKKRKKSLFYEEKFGRIDS